MLEPIEEQQLVDNFAFVLENSEDFVTKIVAPLVDVTSNLTFNVTHICIVISYTLSLSNILSRMYVHPVHCFPSSPCYPVVLLKHTRSTAGAFYMLPICDFVP